MAAPLCPVYFPQTGNTVSRAASSVRYAGPQASRATSPNASQRLEMRNKGNYNNHDKKALPVHIYIYKYISIHIYLIM